MYNPLNRNMFRRNSRVNEVGEQPRQRDRTVNRLFNPLRAALRGQDNRRQDGGDAPPSCQEVVQGHNQGQGGGSGTDAPPTYEQVMQSDREQRQRTAEGFMRRVVEYGALSQISAADARMFRSRLYHPDGKLHLDRAFLLASWEQQYYNRPDFQVKPSKDHFLEFFKHSLKRLNEEQKEAKEKKVEKVDPEACEEAYDDGFQAAKGVHADDSYLESKIQEKVNMVNPDTLELLDGGWGSLW